MKNLTLTSNAKLALKNFGLQYSQDNDVVFAVQCASDYLDTIQDVDGFETAIALFLDGKYSIEVERLNEDFTWRKETVKHLQ